MNEHFVLTYVSSRYYATVQMRKMNVNNGSITAIDLC